MSPTVPPTSVITTSTSSAASDDDAVLDLVGDVRDHLHRLTEVRAVALLGEHRLVDRAGGRVALAVERHVDEALVVPEVEVGLAAVVGDEHLSVLERVHRPGVDVDVGVELLQRDPQAPALQQPPERRCREPLAQARCHSTGHEDVLRQPLASALPIVQRDDANTARFSREADGTMRAPVPRPSWSTVTTGRSAADPRRAGTRCAATGSAGARPRWLRRRRARASARSCSASPRTSRRRTSATTTAVTASPRSRCARATSRSATSSRRRARCSSRSSDVADLRRVRDASTRLACSPVARGRGHDRRGVLRRARAHGPGPRAARRRAHRIERDPALDHRPDHRPTAPRPRSRSPRSRSPSPTAAGRPR